jgi:hypothetical protein
MHPFDISSHAAHLHSGELVAVKVQRPGMAPLLTLDALLFNMIGGQLKRFAKARKDLLVAVNEIVSFRVFLTLILTVLPLYFLNSPMIILILVQAGFPHIPLIHSEYSVWHM